MLQWPLDSGAEARQVVEVQAGEEATSEPQCGEAAFCPTYSTISAWSSHWSAHHLHVTHLFCFPDLYCFQHLTEVPLAKDRGQQHILA
jgi:hypothetical protein